MSMTTVTFSIDQADLDEMIRLSPVIGGNDPRETGEVFLKAVRAYPYPPKTEYANAQRVRISESNRLAEVTGNPPPADPNRMVEEAISEHLKRSQYENQMAAGIHAADQVEGWDYDKKKDPGPTQPAVADFEARLKQLEEDVAALRERHCREVMSEAKPPVVREWQVILVPGFDNLRMPRYKNLEDYIKKVAADGWTIISVFVPPGSIDQWMVVCR